MKNHTDFPQATDHFRVHYLTDKRSEQNEQQMQGPAPREEQPQAPAQAGGDPLESGSVKKELGVKVDNNLPLNQQCVLGTKRLIGSWVH